VGSGDPGAELASFRTEPRAPVAVSAPLLTIGVPAWNAQQFLPRCVSSLLRARNSEKLEVIVVDDGSTDETAAVAARLDVRVVRQPNKGHGGAINTALREARGTFFRVVDADDFVDPVALEKLISALEHETADLVLTGYSEDRSTEALPRPVQTLRRLPEGALTRFDTVLDPLYGLTSWGPILSTSTFRTELLRRCGLRLTESSAYVDLEYCTLGLELVETMRHLPLDLYRYSLGVDGQTVTPESYRKRFRQHEAVIIRLCEFVKHNPRLSEAKRQYIAQRVLAPVITTHLDVVLVLVGEAAEEKSFRKRMEAYPFVHLPPNRALRRLAARAARAALPPALVEALTGAPERSPVELARTLGRYVLPGALSRRNSD
jgi:glycosyltransferase involved in cell wall biosynthesis